MKRKSVMGPAIAKEVKRRCGEMSAEEQKDYLELLHVRRRRKGDKSWSSGDSSGDGYPIDDQEDEQQGQPAQNVHTDDDEEEEEEELLAAGNEKRRADDPDAGAV